MAVSPEPIRVAVAVDPYLVRSTLHAALERDHRFDAWLCPVDVDPVTYATVVGVHMLVVSKPVREAAMCVVLVSQSTETVQLSYAGDRQDVGYVSTAGLQDQLAEQAAAWSLTAC